jgi:hypothetical protein
MVVRSRSLAYFVENYLHHPRRANKKPPVRGAD